MLISSQNMSNNGSYSNDRDVEIAVDASSGGFFFTDFKKHDDLKEMLDSNKDSLKLEAMRRIIGMVAKGKDASVLFPAVVKNVVSKNIEVKKLVYVYLERYAEEQQDLALLSIATFQRALKEPNPLIRAGALRVLSSIRVKMIAPIVMLSIRDASADMSSYVRKTAAHAIPKIYNLDNELKSELVTIIQKLLADKTVLVIGSAVMAFTEVCPERIDLIHRVYRKLCALIVDVDEWGQVVIVNMLATYARMQFANPNLNHNAEGHDGHFYDSSSDSSEKPAPTLDPDHRLLLRSLRPLLQSRNAAVVMAVAQLYNHVAPRNEMQLAVKALVRLLRSHVEVQSIVLNAIASISLKNKELFESYLKSFFVRNSDPTNIKLLKLEILTNLTSEYNVSAILRELQTYISHSDKQFVAATIQAIGRCACSISVVTDSCLNGLVSLLSNRDEAVVAESVVVIKRLLQTQAADLQEIITHMARLLDNITVAQARAAILWLLGEHSQKFPKIAPDVLRKMAKTFAEEDDIVKMQVMNLAIKLYITTPNQTTVLCQYIFNMARYDQNYDIRDKARLLKHFLSTENNRFTKEISKIFLSAKPAPLLHSTSNEHADYQLGSLSHYIKQRAVGYKPLPDFPEVPPPGDVRNVEPLPKTENIRPWKGQDKKFRESSPWTSEASSRDESSSSESESSSEDLSSDGDNIEDESSEAQGKDSSKSGSSETESSSSGEDMTSEESEDEKIERPEKHARNGQKPNSNDRISCQKSNLDLLLDLDDVTNVAPVMTPSMGCFSTPIVPSNIISSIQVVQPSFSNTKQNELLNRMNGKGFSAMYRFTRSPHLYSPSMTNINITFGNNTQENITDIRVGRKNLTQGMNLHEFTSIPCIPPNCSMPATLGIDFNDSAQMANFEIVSSVGNFNVSIKPFIGELMKPVTMPVEVFLQEQSKIRGMNEHCGTIETDFDGIPSKINEMCNVGTCKDEDSNYLRFAGQTLTSSSLCLITFHQNSKVNVTVNCGNAVFGSVLFNELSKILSS